MIALNFGCGTNHLKGWQNYDAEVDITRPLPFVSACADFILAEHVVEHVTYDEALAFFRECRRVLKPAGVVRIAVPSVEQIMKQGTQAYFDFVYRWAPPGENTRRGAMHAILFAHGHKAPWTASLLAVSLYLAGFEDVRPRDPGLSDHFELRAAEGHGRVIGEAFNAIETVICEAS